MEIQIIEGCYMIGIQILQEIHNMNGVQIQQVIIESQQIYQVQRRGMKQIQVK